MKNIENIAEACFGCTACYSICPVNAISMSENARGFASPVVDNSKCIDCGRCVQVCPSINKWDKQKEKDITNIYAFVHKEQKVLCQSTSGGFFTEAVKVYGADYVVGCVQDKELRICHKMIGDLNEIVSMRGSKYVQSDLGESYSLIGQKLKEGYKVVFSGTSCQVHGLENYLNMQGINNSNLLTLDLICHGVPSPKVYRDFLKEYRDVTHRKIVSHFFRCKKYGWGAGKGAANYIQSLVTNEFEDYKSYDANLWQNVFFSDLCLRECCYKCPYTSINKPADITMGDFWGIENIIDEINTKKGCSLVLVRTHKAYELCDKIDLVKIQDRDYSTIVNIQSRLRRPVEIPDNKERFWEDYESYGFGFVKKKYFMYKTINKALIKLYLFAQSIGLRKLSYKIERSIFL